MSRSLLTTAALAPLLALAGGARAETEVTSSSRTTPIATSTANAGAADDVKITSDGTIKPTVSGAVATLDSDNALTNNGALSTNNVSDSVGVLVLGGHAGTVLNSATISLLEDYDYTDDDSDGDYDGLFAKGTGRYGVRLTGDNPFVGTITNDSSGVITLEGNDSAGISLEAALTGSLLNEGAISVTGDRGNGVRNTGTISGDLASTGSISVLGAGSVGVAVEGADADYARGVSAAVEAATGLAPDFSDCRAPTPHPDPSGVAYRHQARRMIQALDARGEITADGPSRLLFLKLSSALAHLDAEPPRWTWRS